MRRRSAPGLLAILLATTSSADWPAGGKLVSSPGDIQGVRHARISLLPSGDLLVLGVGSGGNSYTYNLQRLTHGGLIAPGWPANGVHFTSVLKGMPLRTQSVVVDDAARVWHSFPASSFAALEYIGANAVRVPAGSPYNVGGIATAVRAVPAPVGEAFVTPNATRLKRITTMGAAATGWPASGVALPSFSFHDHALLPDGGGGVVVFMRVSDPAALPIALRFDGNGVPQADWPAGGLTLSNVSPGSDIGPMDSQLLPSGPDHVLAVWSLDAGSGMRRLMMQRFGLDATLDLAWPAGGLEVVAPDTIGACRAIPDGAGGAYIVRQAHRRPVGTHISSGGTVLGSADTDLLDAGAQYIPTRLGPGASTLGIPEDIIADVTSDGNLLVGWNDTRLAPAVTFRLRWLTPALAPAPDKPAEGLVFTPASPNAFAGAFLAVKADGPSGAFLAWSDYHSIGSGQFSGDLWMTYAQAPTTTGVGGAPRALQLSAPRPNPALGSVVLDLVLPDDGGARVDLLDIAGRVMRTRRVDGTGPHSITFDRLGSIAPGLYFARATSARAGATTVRVVVSR